MSPRHLVWKYVLRRDVLDPVIPVRIKRRGRQTPVIWGLLDSGSDRVVVPRWIADGLGLEREPLPIGIMTASGRAVASTTLLDRPLIIDRERMTFTDIRVIVPEPRDVPVLNGRDPVFKTFDVLFMERRGLIRLTSAIVE